MSIKPIHKVAHKNIKVKPNPYFTQSKNHHILPITIHEFSYAAHDFPLVFVKDQETGEFRTVAIVGLQPEENLFYSDNGWKASYIPISLKAYPFLATSAGEGTDQIVVCINEDSDLVNETEGEALFDENGIETEFVKAKGQYLAEMLERNRQTDVFVKCLVSEELLIQRNLSVQFKDEESYDLSGMYIIDEVKLNELLDSDFCELRKLGYLPPIYALLMSLNRVNHLARQKAAMAATVQ